MPDWEELKNKAIVLYIAAFVGTFVCAITLGLIPVVLFRYKSIVILVILYLTSFEVIRVYPYWSIHGAGYKFKQNLLFFMYLLGTTLLVGFWNDFQELGLLKRTATSLFLGSVLLLINRGVLTPLWFYRRRAGFLDHDDIIDRENGGDEDEQWTSVGGSNEEDNWNTSGAGGIGLTMRAVGGDGGAGGNPFDHDDDESGLQNAIILDEFDDDDLEYDSPFAESRALMVHKKTDKKGSGYKGDGYDFNDGEGEDDDDMLYEPEKRKDDRPFWKDLKSIVTFIAYYLFIGTNVLSSIFDFQTQMYFFIGLIPFILIIFFIDSLLQKRLENSFPHLLLYVFFLEAFLVLIPLGKFILTASSQFDKFMANIGFIIFLGLVLYVHEKCAKWMSTEKDYPKYVFMGQSLVSCLLNLFFIQPETLFGSNGWVGWVLLSIQGAHITLKDSGLLGDLGSYLSPFIRKCLRLEIPNATDDHSDDVLAARILLSFQDFVANNLLIALPLMISVDYNMRTTLQGTPESCYVSCRTDPNRIGQVFLSFAVVWVVKMICHFIGFKLMRQRLKRYDGEVRIIRGQEVFGVSFSRKKIIWEHFSKNFMYFVCVIYFVLHYVTVLLSTTSDAVRFNVNA